MPVIWRNRSGVKTSVDVHMVLRNVCVSDALSVCGAVGVRVEAHEESAPAGSGKNASDGDTGVTYFRVHGDSGCMSMLRIFPMPAMLMSVLSDCCCRRV